MGTAASSADKTSPGKAREANWQGELEPRAWDEVRAQEAADSEGAPSSAASGAARAPAPPAARWMPQERPADAAAQAELDGVARQLQRVQTQMQELLQLAKGSMERYHVQLQALQLQP